MRIRELLVQMAERARGRMGFEELDVVSLDEEWVAEERARTDDPVSASIVRFLDDPLSASIVPFCATWAEAGFPRAAIGTRLAASLMATSMDRGNAARLEVPWPALLVQLPDALAYGAASDGAHDAMRLVLAWRFQTGEIGVRVLSESSVWAIRSCPLADFGEDDGEHAGAIERIAAPLPTVEKRSLLLVRRALLGVLAGLPSGAREQLRPGPPSAADPHGPASVKRPARAVSIGLPRELKSDCRDAVSNYVLADPAGARPSPPLRRGAWNVQGDAGEWSWRQPQIGAPVETPTSVRMRVLKSV